jgi:hypothetical protein
MANGKAPLATRYRPIGYLPLEKNAFSFGPCSGLSLTMAAQPAS